MANWRRRCSSRHTPPTDGRRHGRSAALAPLALLAAGCGHAGDQPPPAPAPVPPGAAVTAAPAVAGTPPVLDAATALCTPAATGRLRARLQGAIDAEIDWGEGVAQCRGGVRPQGDGVRLLYKGDLPEAGPLLIVLGAAPLRPGESARNVPVNLTVVREGSGEFYSTQGDGKCALDSVTQAPLDGQPGMFRLEGRGYCTQPARAVGGDGAVLLSRFDVVALVPAAP